ncbi:MAG: major facilitator superfamily transporter [Acidobacteriales bacterium]|nr:major facilitator superfamily transporter [Terriglobales bacterium]
MPSARIANGLRALKHRNFRLFFAGQLISLIGTWMQTVAQSWLVYRLTGSALLLGTVGFASQFPVFLMSPVGGIVADRKNRHRVVIATQVASMTLALILAILTLTNRVQVSHVMILAALLGIVNAFDLPARQAFIMDMVGREDLINAIALNSSMFNGARIVGPAVAGILVASIGEGWCFFANAVSYIAVIVGLMMMHVTHTPKVGHRPALEALREGFSFVRHTKPILALLLLLGLVSLVGMPYTVLMPIFADQILHSGAKGLGILMGATGLGALIAALSLAMRTGMKGLGTWVARASVAFGFTLMAFAFSRWFWVSAAVLVVLGFSMMMQMTASNTLIQSMVPDRLRGRVMSVYAMMFMGMAPIGAFSAGAVAHRLGAPMTLAIGGIACVMGAGLFTYELPGFRVEARKLILAQETGVVGMQSTPVVSDADVAVAEAALVAGPLADSGAEIVESDR